MRNVPEMRPVAIANRETGETELTAAMWDEELNAWVTSDERAFEGPKPDESEGLIIAEQTPSLPDGLLSEMKDAVDNLRMGGGAEAQMDRTTHVSESHVRENTDE